MAYARMTGRDSDVYVFSDGNHLHCQWCRLSADSATFLATEYSTMIAHLEDHRRQGHRIPDYALEALRKEGGVTDSVERASELFDAGLLELE